MWKVILAKVPQKIQGTNWPTDFNMNGDVRHECESHGWAAKNFANDKNELPQRQYIIYWGYYLLCGDEGKAMKIEHILAKKKKTAEVLAISNIVVVDQALQEPIKSKASVPKKAPRQQAPFKQPMLSLKLTPPTSTKAAAAVSTSAKAQAIKKATTKITAKKAATPLSTMSSQTLQSSILLCVPHQSSSTTESISSYQEELQHLSHKNADTNKAKETRNANFDSAMTRGRTIHNTATTTMQKIIKTDHTTSDNQASLDKEISTVEGYLAALKDKRRNLYNEEKRALLLIPKDLVDKLNHTGYMKDAQEIEKEINAKFCDWVKRK